MMFAPPVTSAVLFWNPMAWAAPLSDQARPVFGYIPRQRHLHFVPRRNFWAGSPRDAVCERNTGLVAGEDSSQRLTAGLSRIGAAALEADTIAAPREGQVATPIGPRAVTPREPCSVAAAENEVVAAPATACVALRSLAQPWWNDSSAVVGLVPDELPIPICRGVVSTGAWRFRPMITAKDSAFLRRAIEIAAAAITSGDAPYGSLLVDAQGAVLMQAHNTVQRDRDISAHPELKLARWAARELSPETAAATTMYTSCQPCGMCTGAIVRSGLGRVVYALSTEQVIELNPGSDWPTLRQDGPALFDEARVPIERYYQTGGDHRAPTDTA
jgi:tRNA(Arg) A34 adenosine deaminase TadA